MATTATAIPITPTNIGGELVADDESGFLNCSECFEVPQHGQKPFAIDPR
jgi:hypothetical protein